MYVICVFTKTGCIQLDLQDLKDRVCKTLQTRIRKLGSISIDHNTNMSSILHLHMASKKRSAIEMFVEHIISQLPDAIKDISHNDHYKPQDDIVDNWTVLVEKNEKEIFVLRFAYQIKADIDDSKKWIKLKSWIIECAVAQGDYVAIDLEKKDD